MDWTYRSRLVCGLGAALVVAALMGSARAAIYTESVEYNDGEAVLEGYLAYDDALDGKRPGVLIVHEWWGLGTHPKRVAERLAGLGYVAFALDMYGKGKLTDDAKQAGEWAGAFRTDSALAKRRFEAGLSVLRENDHVDASRIVAIGYCFGGGICLEMARMGVDLAGVVSFHGGLKSAVPETDRKPITAKILVCHGADDPSVPPAEVAAFEEEMRAAGADWVLIAYGGAVHSFTNPDADRPTARYNEKADRRSWKAMRQFLAEVFVESPDGLPLLQPKLDEIGPRSRAGSSAETRAVFAAAIDKLAKSGILEKATNVGDTAPLFELPDASGKTVKLADLLKQGPVVIAWYRGGWCPYCSAELPALEQALPAIRDRGATLVAISPQTVENSADTAKKLGLTFPLLSDAGGKVAERYGIRYVLDSEVSAIYKQFGLDLKKANDDDSDTLPLAATYIIASDGKVRYAFIDADYKKRAEPRGIVEALDKLGER
ncbi:MAG: dienelactone hydrolase family protein [Verrucomicrobia bacterium]|nr:dienelactone hydrolase family protein [Verrucomicrobiota bacterium]